MRKIVNPCICDVDGKAARAFVEIKFDEGRLSISGVVGPTRNGNCLGSAGQCVDEIRAGTPAEKWTNEMLQKLCSIWDAWHLNDMRPYCEHQKQLGWRELARMEVICPGISGATEKKALGWLRPEDHPDGILCKPCPVCGYKYGTAWKTEEVPKDIIDWLFNLPSTKVTPAWV